MALIEKDKVVIYKGNDTLFLIPYDDDVVDFGVNKNDMAISGIEKYEEEIVKGFDDTVTVNRGEEGKIRQGGKQGGIAKGESVFEYTEGVTDKITKELEKKDGTSELKTFQGDSKQILKEAVETAKKAEKKEETVPYTVHPLVNQKDKDTEYEVKLGSIGEYKKIQASIYSQVAFIKKWLHRLVNDKRYARWVGGERQGRRLNRKILHTIPTGNRYIYMIKEQTDILDIAFSLLIDESGSMSGCKTEEARRCAVMFSELLHEIGVPFELIGFTTAKLTNEQMIESKKVQHLYKNIRYNRTDNLRHNMYKRFDESYPKVKTRLVNISSCMYNFDQDHIEFAWNRLKVRREKKKVLIVASDSQPCGGEAARLKLKRVVNSIGCTPGAEVIGIGIQAPYMSEFYHKFVDISDVSQLGMNVVRLIKAAFIDASQSKRRG